MAGQTSKCVINSILVTWKGQPKPLFTHGRFNWVHTWVCSSSLHLWHCAPHRAGQCIMGQRLNWLHDTKWQDIQCMWIPSSPVLSSTFSSWSIFLKLLILLFDITFILVKPTKKTKTEQNIYIFSPRIFTVSDLSWRYSPSSPGDCEKSNFYVQYIEQRELVCNLSDIRTGFKHVIRCYIWFSIFYPCFSSQIPFFFSVKNKKI